MVIPWSPIGLVVAKEVLPDQWDAAFQPTYLNVLSCFLTLSQSFKVFRFGSLSNGLSLP